MILGEFVYRDNANSAFKTLLGNESCNDMRSEQTKANGR
jgi:hypothetical protein